MQLEKYETRYIRKIILLQGSLELFAFQILSSTIKLKIHQIYNQAFCVLIEQVYRSKISNFYTTTTKNFFAKYF